MRDQLLNIASQLRQYADQLRQQLAGQINPAAPAAQPPQGAAAPQAQPAPAGAVKTAGLGRRVSRLGALRRLMTRYLAPAVVGAGLAGGAGYYTYRKQQQRFQKAIPAIANITTPQEMAQMQQIAEQAYNLGLQRGMALARAKAKTKRG